ncbi:MAG: pantetheine-phosphate adenylyltransferase [Pseudomonadota bacterium]
MTITAIYPGTFDPVTNGHIDVARRAAKLFDRVVIAIAHNPDKRPFFPLEEREDLAKQVLADVPNIEVRSFRGLLVNCAREWKAQVIVRGLRAVSDYEYEVQLAGLNRQMEPDVETVFISADREFTFLSSSMVREIARLDGDVSDFVHPIVLEALKQRSP